MNPIEELAKELMLCKGVLADYPVSYSIAKYLINNGWTRLSHDDRVVKVGDLEWALNWRGNINTLSELKNNSVTDRLKKALEK